MISGDNVMSWLERTASVLAALVPVVMAVLAARHRTRLSREEEMWRQVLGANPDLALARELHRRAAVQLMARNLAPEAAPLTRAGLALGVLLAAGGGVLGATLAADYGWSDLHRQALLLILVLLGGGWVFLYLGLDELTAELDARHRVARQVLGDAVHVLDGKTRLWMRMWRLLALSAAAVAITAGLGGTFWGLGWTFALGMPYPIVAIGSVVVYLLGMASLGSLWRTLVTRPPDPPPLPSQDKPAGTVIDVGVEEAGHHAAASLNEGDHGMPRWPLFLGLAVGAAAGHLLSGRRT